MLLGESPSPAACRRADTARRLYGRRVLRLDSGDTDGQHLARKGEDGALLRRSEDVLVGGVGRIPSARVLRAHRPDAAADSRHAASEQIHLQQTLRHHLEGVGGQIRPLSRRGNRRRQRRFAPGRNRCGSGLQDRRNQPRHVGRLHGRNAEGETRRQNHRRRIRSGGQLHPARHDRFRGRTLGIRRRLRMVQAHTCLPCAVDSRPHRDGRSRNTRKTRRGGRGRHNAPTDGGCRGTAAT